MREPRETADQPERGNDARGGKTETLEGDWSPTRLVILQFDNTEQAKSWLNSTEYSQARSLRHETAISNMVVIEGV